uniref:Orf1 n=1 Tax=Dansoman virus TaxID=1654363 RepID=A0A2Z4QKL4_9VIRU|nr:orf1 [Dansoman virus]
MDEVNNLVKTTVDSLRPGRMWYTDAHLIVDPPKTLLHKASTYFKDFLRPREHPLLVGARWIAARARNTTSALGENGEGLGWAAPAWAGVRVGLRAIWWCASHWLFIGVATCAAGGTLAWWWRTRRLRCITVSGLGPVDHWYAMRRRFEVGVARVRDGLPSSVEGSHRRIAAERRGLEDLCNQWFAEHGLRFRDVGGSRTRGASVRGLRHACNPIIDGADILREAKTPVPSSHRCTGMGEDCTWKDAFPAALLVHSDYYMSQDSLCDIVRGPTFIITHRFVGDEGLLHGELKWQKRGDKIKAQTEDGTPYSHHYNLWQTEGVCVGRRGAFVYCRLGTTGATDLIWAYPADGVYRSDDPNALERSCDWPKIRLNNNRYAIVNSQEFSIWTRDKDQLVMRGDREVLSRVELRLGGAARGPEWLGTMAAYVQARCQASEIAIADPINMVELCATLCERYATTIYSRWNRQWSPAQMGWGTRALLAWDRAWRAINIILRLPIPVRSLTTWGGRRIAPWVYNNLTLACYVMEVRRDDDMDISNTRPDNRFFREQRETDDAPPDDGQHDGASSLPRQHRGERDDEGPGGESEPTPVVDDDAAPQTDRQHAGQSPQPPSDERELGEDVRDDGVDVPTGDAVRRCATAGHSASDTQHLVVLSGLHASTNGGVCVVLDTQRNEIQSDVLDQPFVLPSDSAGPLLEQADQLVAFMQGLKQDDPHAATEKLHSWIQARTRRAACDTAAPVGGGVAKKRRNGVVSKLRRTTCVGYLGKKVSCKPKRATARGTAARPAHGNPAAGRASEEFREAGNNTQLHRPAEHQPQDGRIPGGDGALRVANRTRSDEVPVFD